MPPLKGLVIFGGGKEGHIFQFWPYGMSRLQQCTLYIAVFGPFSYWHNFTCCLCPVPHILSPLSLSPLPPSLILSKATLQPAEWKSWLNYNLGRRLGYFFCTHRRDIKFLLFRRLLFLSLWQEKEVRVPHILRLLFIS